MISYTVLTQEQEMDIFAFAKTVYGHSSFSERIDKKAKIFFLERKLNETDEELDARIAAYLNDYPLMF